MKINNNNSFSKQNISNENEWSSQYQPNQNAQPHNGGLNPHIFEIHWQIQFQTKFGESIGIVGNCKELGYWKIESALKLHWSENNIWRGSAILNIEEEMNEKSILEYKYILIDDENKQTVKWEEGQNRFYYYSQIYSEAQQKSSCFCPPIQNQNSERARINSNNFNNNNINSNSNRTSIKTINNYSLINNNNIANACVHELHIQDVWSKKCIIFRISQDKIYNQSTKNQQFNSNNLTLPKFTSFDKENNKQQQYQQDSSQSLESPLFNNSSSNSLSLSKSDQENESHSSASIAQADESIQKNNQMNNDKQISYLITGNHKALGSLRYPQNMIYNEQTRSWEFKIEVDRDIQYIRYFYIKKDNHTNNSYWEKGSGRFVYMQPLNNPCSFNASAVNSCQSSQLQSSHSLSDINFIALKNELLLSSPNLRSINNISQTSQSHSDTKLTNHILNTQFQCTCCYPKKQPEKASQRMQGKMSVNPLKNGIFQTETQQKNLDFSLSFDNISEQLFIGPYVSNSEKEVQQLKSAGIDTVFSLQTDEDMIRRQVDKNLLKEQYKKNGIEFYNIPIKDKSQKDFFLKSQEAVDKLYHLLRNPKRVLYLHCTGGISRAPQVAILYFCLFKNISLKKAIRSVCNKRESAYPDEDLLNSVYTKSIDNQLNYNYEEVSN